MRPQCGSAEHECTSGAAAPDNARADVLTEMCWTTVLHEEGNDPPGLLPNF